MSQAGPTLTLVDIHNILGSPTMWLRRRIRARDGAFGRLPFDDKYTVATEAFREYYAGAGRRQGRRPGALTVVDIQRNRVLERYRKLAPPEVLTPDVATSLEAAGVVLARAENFAWKERFLKVKKRPVVPPR